MSDRAECPVCGKIINVTLAGVMRSHKLVGAECPGVGQEPAVVAVDPEAGCCICRGPVTGISDPLLTINGARICPTKQCIDAALAQLHNRARRLREAYAEFCIPDDGRPDNDGVIP